jgi:hypothetical protein
MIYLLYTGADVGCGVVVVDEQDDNSVKGLLLLSYIVCWFCSSSILNRIASCSSLKVG